MTPSQRDVMAGLSVIALLAGILWVFGIGAALITAGAVGLAVAIGLTLRSEEPPSA